MSKKTLTTKSGRVKELTRKDIQSMRPAAEVLPPDLVAMLPKRKRGERGPQKEPRKILMTSRYSPEVLRYFKATGEGWQTRIDEVLKAYIKKHPRHRSQ
jgi:uncharacterized protein (DUF4415 family)